MGGRRPPSTHHRHLKRMGGGDEGAVMAIREVASWLHLLGLDDDYDEEDGDKYGKNDDGKGNEGGNSYGDGRRSSGSKGKARQQDQRQGRQRRRSWLARFAEWHEAARKQKLSTRRRLGRCLRVAKGLVLCHGVGCLRELVVLLKAFSANQQQPAGSTGQLGSSNGDSNGVSNDNLDTFLPPPHPRRLLGADSGVHDRDGDNTVVTAVLKRLISEKDAAFLTRVFGTGEERLLVDRRTALGANGDGGDNDCEEDRAQGAAATTSTPSPTLPVSTPVLPCTTSPSDLRIVVMWSGVPSPHHSGGYAHPTDCGEDSHNDESDLRNGATPLDGGDDGGGGDGGGGGGGGGNGGGRVGAEARGGALKAALCPVPLMDEQTMGLWLTESAATKQAVCPLSGRAYTPRLHFRVLEPCLVAGDGNDRDYDDDREEVGGDGNANGGKGSKGENHIGGDGGGGGGGWESEEMSESTSGGEDDEGDEKKRRSSLPHREQLRSSSFSSRWALRAWGRNEEECSDGENNDENDGNDGSSDGEELASSSSGSRCLVDLSECNLSAPVAGALDLYRSDAGMLTTSTTSFPNTCFASSLSVAPTRKNTKNEETAGTRPKDGAATVPATMVAAAPVSKGSEISAGGTPLEAVDNAVATVDAVDHAAAAVDSGSVADKGETQEDGEGAGGSCGGVDRGSEGSGGGEGQGDTAHGGKEESVSDARPLKKQPKKRSSSFMNTLRRKVSEKVSTGPGGKARTPSPPSSAATAVAAVAAATTPSVRPPSAPDRNGCDSANGDEANGDNADGGEETEVQDEKEPEWTDDDDDDDDGNDNDGPGSGVGGGWVGSVRYLSPSELREGLECVLANSTATSPLFPGNISGRSKGNKARSGAGHGGGGGGGAGEAALSRTALRKRHPTLFWNLWWWSSRLGLPFPLCEGPGDLTQQWVGVCGWDALATHRTAAEASRKLIQSLVEFDRGNSRRTARRRSTNTVTKSGPDLDPTATTTPEQPSLSSTTTTPMPGMVGGGALSGGSSNSRPRWCELSGGAQLPLWPSTNTHPERALVLPSDGGCFGSFQQLNQHKVFRVRAPSELRTEAYRSAQRFAVALATAKPFSSTQSLSPPSSAVSHSSVFGGNGAPPPFLIGGSARGLAGRPSPPPCVVDEEGDDGGAGGDEGDEGDGVSNGGREVPKLKTSATLTVESLAVETSIVPGTSTQQQRRQVDAAVAAAVTGLLKRRLSDPLNFEANLYRSTMRLALVAASSAANSLRPLSRSPPSNSLSSSRTSALQVFESGPLSTIPSPPATEGTCGDGEGGDDVENNCSRLSLLVSSTPFDDPLMPAFDRAYCLAVETVVDDELMPSDRAAAFKGCGSGPLRASGDLIPRRRELALRAAFGHLF